MVRPPNDLDALPFPVLFADIGGTNARFAILVDADAEPRHYDNVEAAEFPTIAAALAGHIMDRSSAKPRSLVFAVAGPIREDKTPLTNSHWVVEPKALMAEFGFEHVILFNDFEALALALPGLAGEDLVAVGPSITPHDGTKIVIGPGTGLGAAGLVHANHVFVPVPGEGGHIDLAPRTPRDFAIWPNIDAEDPRISGETLVCGSGLCRLYKAVAKTDGIQPIHASSPASITAAAEAGDPTAREALELFCAYLGRIAGDLALTFLAKGGVYLAGGIAPRVLSILAKGGFRKAFEDKHPHEELLRAMATVVVVHDRPALAGLIAYARSPSRFGVQLEGRHWQA